MTFGGSERALGRTPDAGLADVPAIAADEESGPSTGFVIGLLAGALILAAAAALLVRRRRQRRSAAAEADVDGELAELLRALRRSGRAPPPQLTLAALPNATRARRPRTTSGPRRGALRLRGPPAHVRPAGGAAPRARRRARSSRTAACLVGAAAEGRSPRVGRRQPLCR